MLRYISSKGVIIAAIVSIAAILSMLFLAFYSMQIEDMYGDNQEIYYQSRDGDIVINFSKKEVGIIHKNWMSFKVISNQDTLNVSYWWNDHVAVLRSSRTNEDSYSLDYHKTLSLIQKKEFEIVLEL